MNPDDLVTPTDPVEPPLQRTTQAVRRGRPRGRPPNLAPRTKAIPRTAGHPAVAAAVVSEPQFSADEFVDEEGKPLERRVSLANGGAGINLEVPPKYKRAGWDYEFKTHKVVGQEVDGGDWTAVAEGGWIPVRPAEMPDMLPPGYTGNTIDRYGMRCFKRPMKFTEEARQELLDRAIRETTEKVRAAMQGNDNEGSAHTMRYVNESKIEGEAGEIKQRSA